MADEDVGKFVQQALNDVNEEINLVQAIISPGMTLKEYATCRVHLSKAYGIVCMVMADYIETRVHTVSKIPF